jgi:protein SCO1/2
MISRHHITLVCSFATLAVLPQQSLRGQAAAGKLTSQVGFDQRLGAKIPLDLAFRDESGRSLRLRDLFKGRPVVVAPVYYRCPMLCNLLLEGLVRSLKPLSLGPGKDFEILAYSIDPLDNADRGRRKKSDCLERYGRAETQSGWHFLTGESTAIEALSAAIGFRYTYNAGTGLYAHAAGVVLATPDGRIARYFYGIDFPPKELQAQIVAAGSGKVGSPIARLLLFCYDYDAATGKYTLSIMRLLRVSGTATALLLFGFLIVMFRRERKARDAAASHVQYTAAYPTQPKSRLGLRHPPLNFGDFQSDHSL